MIPAVLATAMPEGTITPICNQASPTSARFGKSKTRRAFHCKICLSECPSKRGKKLENCSCLFCKECLEQYISYSISTGNVLNLPCPDAMCRRSGLVTSHEVSCLVTDEMFQKYLELLKKKEVAIDKTKTFCPVIGCDGICDGLPGVAQPALCQECGHTFCFVCKENWHATMTCEDYNELTSDSTSGARFVDILRENGETGDIKECPLCQVLILRDAGCAQMLCGNCKHVFCWHCRTSLDSDIMLRHYDKGPCRNKLGHSRASLFLHRTQVVAGFVFFGVMILVASPFLLVVSPCLLLSKCFFRKE